MNGPGRSTMLSKAGSSTRTSRTDGKFSFIPKPKFGRADSFDRLSEVGTKRPGRTLSTDRARGTLSTAGRPSRDAAISSKNSMLRRSKSAMNCDVVTTPRVGSTLYGRNTVTPSRTPSAERGGKSWQKSLERALAYVVVKDRRPITTPEWQKQTMARIAPILMERFESETSLLVRPLTIVRFVDVVAKLLSLLLSIPEKHQINSTNYVTNLPRFTKRLLYPGPISKSWLKTVNTLHTFPNALALIAYLVDMVCRYEAPCTDEWLYVNNDEASKLQKEYILKAWNLFQSHGDLENLEEEYATCLRQLHGLDPDKLQMLHEEIEEFREHLSDPADLAAAEDERRLGQRINNLLLSLKDASTEIIQIKTEIGQIGMQSNDRAANIEDLEKNIYKIRCEIESVQNRVESQSMSAQEREQILETINFSNEVLASKMQLIEEVTNMLANRDKELSRRQKEAMESCVGYNQRIISLSTYYDCTRFQVEERRLVCKDELERVSEAVEAFRNLRETLDQRLRQQQRQRDASARRLSQQNNVLNQLMARREELAASHSRAREVARANRSQVDQKKADLLAKARASLEKARQCRLAAEDAHRKAKKELQAAVVNDQGWRSKLADLRSKVDEHESSLQKLIATEKEKRLKAAESVLADWSNALRGHK